MASNDSTYKFLDEPPDALKCLICMDVAQEPHQHGKGGCGRLFCGPCLDKYGRNKPCPNCRMENPKYFEDSKSKREIQSLHVMCANVDRGCEWVGTIGKLADHTSTCGYTLIPCPNECKDDNGKTLIMKKNLDQHMNKDCPKRNYKCKHCKKEDTYINITEVHDQNCELKVIPCTNDGCSIRLKRQKLNHHVQFKCSHTVIACKHQSIGCEERLKRKEMAVHEKNSDLHLDMAIETISLLKEQSSVLSLVDGAYTTTFTLQDYQDKKRTNAVYYSPSFYTGRNGYHMKIWVYANGAGDGQGTHISVFAYIIEGKHDKELKWPFLGEVKTTLLNQEEDRSHYTKTTPFGISKAAKVQDNWGYPCYIPHSELESQPYLQNDSLHFKVSVTVDDCKPWLE